MPKHQIVKTYLAIGGTGTKIPAKTLKRKWVRKSFNNGALIRATLWGGILRRLDAMVNQ
jgi:hypothetical protein